jgi:hypothetical protein
MADVIWSRRAERTAFALRGRARAELFEVIAHLRNNPEMFQVIEAGRYRGLRRAPVGRYWALLYRVGNPDRTCYLAEIRDMRRRPV